MRLVEGRATVDDVDAFVSALADVGDVHGCAIQAFDARYVAGREHLESAVDHAERAFERGENVARDRGVEMLLYAAGRRQINQALEMGVEAGEVPVVVVVVGEEPEAETAEEAEGETETETTEDAAAAAVAELLEPAATLDAGDPETIRDFFAVTDAEVAATTATLEALVCERVALLDVEK